MNSALFKSDLMHHRFLPKTHHFSYRMYTWFFDLDELSQLDKKLSLFSRNRFNLFSFYDGDYGDKSGRPLRDQINSLLRQNNLDTPEQIYLLCCPRVLGYVFNPLSVFYCFREETLYAVVYEVSNTFGERHSYVIPADDGQTVAVSHQFADKKLHVSPFFQMECFYRFKVREPDDALHLNIKLFQQDAKKLQPDLEQRLFVANLRGSRLPISSQHLLQSFLAVPFQTLKVITAIHWQALKLWLKGISVIPHKPANSRFAFSKGAVDGEIMNSTGEKQ